RLIQEGVEVKLAGPVAQGGGDAADALSELVALGANYHGMLDLPNLAKLMVSSTVGLIPYELNSYTRGVSPLKVYEYLAAGLHVVSTPIPSVNPMPGHVEVASTAEEFVSQVLGSLHLPASADISLRRT